MAESLKSRNAKARQGDAIRIRGEALEELNNSMCRNLSGIIERKINDLMPKCNKNQMGQTETCLSDLIIRAGYYHTLVTSGYKSCKYPLSEAGGTDAFAVSSTRKSIIGIAAEGFASSPDELSFHLKNSLDTWRTGAKDHVFYPSVNEGYRTAMIKLLRAVKEAQSQN